jgi:DNA-binding NarL/FixJ family response regulator
MPLTGRQAEVLTAAADGSSLVVVAGRLGTSREQVSARLSEAYRRLDVSWVPRDERRAAAVRVARGRGLIPDASPESPPKQPQEAP